MRTLLTLSGRPGQKARRVPVFKPGQRAAWAAAGLMAFLAACSSAPPTPAADVTPPAPTPTPAPASSDPITQLQAFTLADLRAASADAHANNDKTAYQCYDFLIASAPTLPSLNPGQQVGAVIAFQKARDLQNAVAGVNGQLQSLNIACAALVIDTQTVINKLILLGAGGVATGGVLAPILPAIAPMIAPALP